MMIKYSYHHDDVAAALKHLKNAMTNLKSFRIIQCVSVFSEKTSSDLETHFTIRILTGYTNGI